MTMIKVCGLVCERDIAFVNRYMPDFAGFVFAPGRRMLEPETAALLASKLDRRICRAGVFVNAGIDDIISVAHMCRLDIIQLHGDETPQYLQSLMEKAPEMEIWKAVRVWNTASLGDIMIYNAGAFLLDTDKPGSYGGTGTCFDWNLARETNRFGKKIILAGGLNCTNVREAIKIVRPYAVDVSSGVETNGSKDELKISDFIGIVRKLNDV